MCSLSNDKSIYLQLLQIKIEDKHGGLAASNHLKMMISTRRIAEHSGDVAELQGDSAQYYRTRACEWEFNRSPLG
jgi:hypothetical protein